MNFIKILLSLFIKKQPAPIPVPTPEPVVVKPDPDEARKELFFFACTFLGKDASPEDIATDEYGCAETVTDIVHKCFGDLPKEGKTIVSTTKLYEQLKKHPKFRQTFNLKPGNIIISPTGYGNGTIKNGHTGIIGENQTIMSNSSKTGNFEKNYTIKSWVDRFRLKGGFPVFVFERIEI